MWKEFLPNISLETECTDKGVSLLYWENKTLAHTVLSFLYYI